MKMPRMKGGQVIDNKHFMKIKMKKFTKKNIAKLLVKIQDEGCFESNCIATEAIEQFGLENEAEQFQNPKGRISPNRFGAKQ